MTETHADAVPDRPIHVESADELDDVLRRHDRVLVELYTEGCAICQSMEPVLGTVARATGVPVVTVNPRDDPPLVERFDVRSVPTFVLMVDGEEVERIADGFVGAERLVEFARA